MGYILAGSDVRQRVVMLYGVCRWYPPAHLLHQTRHGPPILRHRKDGGLILSHQLHLLRRGSFLCLQCLEKFGLTSLTDESLVNYPLLYTMDLRGNVPQNVRRVINVVNSRCFRILILDLNQNIFFLSTLPC